MRSPDNYPPIEAWYFCVPQKNRFIERNDHSYPLIYLSLFKSNGVWKIQSALALDSSNEWHSSHVQPLNSDPLHIASLKAINMMLAKSGIIMPIANGHIHGATRLLQKKVIDNFQFAIASGWIDPLEVKKIINGERNV